MKSIKMEVFKQDHLFMLGENIDNLLELIHLHSGRAFLVKKCVDVIQVFREMMLGKM